MSYAVTVVIPVYDAERFVRTAVESAVALAEVGEVIVVEDGSTDASLEVCRSLAREHDRVRLFTHPGRRNRGTAASRNVGIRRAKCPCIAFLDADDFYLPNRFEAARRILPEREDIDGVYDAVGTHFWSAEGKSWWGPNEKTKLTTVTETLPPEDLFCNLSPVGPCGYFHVTGIVVRKAVFDRVGYFDTRLFSTPDTNMWLRLAAVTRLAPGNIEAPCAMRGVHGDNMSRNRRRASLELIEALARFISWAIREHVAMQKVSAALQSWGRLCHQHQQDFPEDRWLPTRRVAGLVDLMARRPAVSRLPEFRSLLSATTGYWSLKKKLAC